jgi:HYR domain
MKSKLNHISDLKPGVKGDLFLQRGAASILSPAREGNFLTGRIRTSAIGFIRVLILALIFCAPGRLLGDSITATITVDNGYAFGFGDTNGIFPGQFYGGIDNCSPQAIFGNCYVFVPPDNPSTDDGPEIYNITANWTNYLYIVAWSDDGGLQGTVASFTDNDTGITVGTSPAWPWQVFATGTNWAPNCSNVGAHGPPLTGFKYAINNQIAIADAGSGGPGTSVTWIGNTATPNGRLDFSGEFNGNIYFDALPSCMPPSATWMEYNPEPANPDCNPFSWGSVPDYTSIPNFLREYLIYRVGPIGQIFTTSNTCNNGCIAIINPNGITVTTCSNSLPVTYLAHAIDNCCSNYTLTSIPASGSDFPLGTTTVTSTVTDTCGHTNNCTFTVTVIQNTNAPIIYGCPINIIVCGTNGCGAMPDVTSEVQAVAAIGGANVVVTQSIPPGTVLCSNTNVIFTVSDACGDATNCTVPCILDTNSPAIIYCPTNITICISSNGCGPMPDATGQVLATTVVGGPVVVTQSIPPGTLICNDTNVTFTFTDNCGNATNCTVPCTLFNCTNCMQIQCWTNIVVTSCTNLPVYYNPTAVDVCCSNWFTYCSPPSGSIFDVGTTQTVLFAVLDACGNSNGCTFTVTVNSSYLQVQTPGNILINSCTNVLVAYPQLVVSDPCCGTNWNVVYDPPSGTSFAPNTHTLVNWFLYDCASGTNFAAANSFLVSVSCTNCCVGPITNYTVTVVKGSNYLADCLCQGTSNTLADVLPSVPAGTEVYFWNPTAGQFNNPPDTFTATGWSPGTEPMVPGEGFLLVSFTNQYHLTIYGIDPGCGPGCTPLGCASPTVLAGDYGLEPNPADFCDLFCCLPASGTEVRVWDAASQSFTAYTYNGAWSPPAGPPALPVGYSEFVSVDNSLPVIFACPTNIVICTNGDGCGPMPDARPQVQATESTGITQSIAPGTLICSDTNVTFTITNACGYATNCVVPVTLINCGLGGAVMTSTFGGGNVNSFVLNWSTNGLAPNFWQVQYSTDLFNWTFYGVTNPVLVSPFTIPITASQGFYRLVHTN